MSAILRTIRNYVFWSYERGTFHYDIIVVLIVLFVLFSPRLINYNDKPVERVPHQTGVVIAPDPGGAGGFIYQVPAAAVPGSSPEDVETALLRVIEPIAGEVTIDRYEAVRDRAGKVESYRVWVRR